MSFWSRGPKHNCSRNRLVRSSETCPRPPMELKTIARVAFVAERALARRSMPSRTCALFWRALALQPPSRRRRGLRSPWPEEAELSLRYAADRLHWPPVLAERRWPATCCGAAQRTARACGRLHGLLRLLPTRQGACVRRGQLPRPIDDPRHRVGGGRHQGGCRSYRHDARSRVQRSLQQSRVLWSQLR